MNWTELDYWTAVLLAMSFTTMGVGTAQRQAAAPPAGGDRLLLETGDLLLLETGDGLLLE